MPQQAINIGTTANDGTGDTPRASFTKVNANFTELYSTAATDAKLNATNDFGGNIIIGARQSVTISAATAFTPSSTTDIQTLYRMTAATPIAVTLPNAGFTLGCSVTFMQAGLGQITISGASGTVIEAYAGGIRSIGQFAKIDAQVTAVDGSNNLTWTITGGVS